MKRLIILIAFLLPISAYSYDFTEIEIQYGERYYKSVDQLLQMRTEYEQVISSHTLSESELVHAVSQVAKIDLLIADYLPEITQITKKKRWEVSEHCLTAINKIQNISRGTYATFGLRCLYTRYLGSSLVELAESLSRFLNFIEDNRVENASGFDRGEYYRALAHVKMNRRFKLLGVWLYKPNEALELANKSYETDRNSAEAAYIQGKALIVFAMHGFEISHAKKAIRVWEQALDELEFFESIGAEEFYGRRLENIAIKKRIEEHMKKIKQCTTESDWISCFYKNSIDLSI